MTTKAVKDAIKKKVKEKVKAKIKKIVKDKIKEGVKPEAEEDKKQQALEAVSPDAAALVSDLLELTTLQGLFNKVYGESPDQLYIKVNGFSIWPNGGRDWRNTKSQQHHVLNLEYIVDASKPLSVDLWEYDSGSSDDNLGNFHGLTLNADDFRLTTGPENPYRELVALDQDGKTDCTEFTLTMFDNAVIGFEFLGQQYVRSTAAPDCPYWDPGDQTDFTAPRGGSLTNSLGFTYAVADDCSLTLTGAPKPPWEK